MFILFRFSSLRAIAVCIIIIFDSLCNVALLYPAIVFFGTKQKVDALSLRNDGGSITGWIQTRTPLF